MRMANPGEVASRKRKPLQGQCARRSIARRNSAFTICFRLEKSTAKPGERRVSGRACNDLKDLWLDQITICERDVRPEKHRRGRARLCIMSRTTQGPSTSGVAKQ